MPDANDGFTPFEELQNVLMLLQNKIVRAEFADLSDDEPTGAGGRARLKAASLLTDNDSAIEMLLRLMLYYFVMRKGADLLQPIYGIPVTSFQESVKFYPQVRLYFSEDAHDVEHGFHPVESELSFRLVNETSESLSKADALSLAHKIQTVFCTGGGFRWKKGREIWTYRDQKKGYKLMLYAWNESEAKRVIEHILEVRGHTPEWSKYLEGTDPKGKTFPTVPPEHTIYGKPRRMPRERPIAYVRFRYAELKLHGLPNDIQLVDRSGTRRNPLVKAN